MAYFVPEIHREKWDTYFALDNPMAGVDKVYSQMPREINNDENEWSNFSLTVAMRGMKDEPSPYTESDLKERF